MAERPGAQGTPARRQEIVIRPGRGLFSLSFSELWRSRELLFFLTWRNVKVKYKQSLLGAAWVIFRPVVMMIIFSLLFGKVAKFPSDGAPYTVFVFLGLLPWVYFSTALSETTQSLVAGSNLISKVYFPRILVPLSANLSNLIDFFVTLSVFLLMMLYYRIRPQWGMLLVPLLILSFFLCALGVGLLFSALNVRYRDVGYIIPFIVQVWMFATPVIYPVTFLPDRYRMLMYLNPMAGPIETFRSSVLGHVPVNFGGLAVSLTVMLLLLAAGLTYFKKVERTFADVI